MMKSLNKRYRNIPQHKVTCDRPISSVQWLSRVRLFATPWITARQVSLSIINSQSSPKFMSIELVMPSSHLILCHPLLLLPSILYSIRVFFKWVSTLHQVTKVLEFQQLNSNKLIYGVWSQHGRYPWEGEVVTKGVLWVLSKFCFLI